MATKWGIVSCGKISHDFAVSITTLPSTEHQVIAAAARNADDAKKFATLHKIPKAYSSYDELANDPEVEVVYIGSINTQHLNIAKKMLMKGKHLLVEKPLTLNYKNSKELIDLAKEKNVFLMEALWSRFLPSYKFAMKQIEDNAIGDVRFVNVNFGFKLDFIDRLAKKELGGGTILDLGIYVINVVLMALNGERPKEIKAMGCLNDNGVDTVVTASLKFSNDRFATITTSASFTLPCEAHIIGTKGDIKLPMPMWCADKVVVNGKTHEFPFPETVLKCNFMNSAGLRYEAIEVRRCLQNGLKESPFMSHKDSLIIAEIEDELRKQVGVTFDEDK